MTAVPAGCCAKRRRMRTVDATRRCSKATRSGRAAMRSSSGGRVFRRARHGAAEASVRRRRGATIRHRGCDAALSRSAARFAVELVDVPRQLGSEKARWRAGTRRRPAATRSVSCWTARSVRSRLSRRRKACSTSSARNLVGPAPRKAAPRAIAARAPWSSRNSMATACAFARSTRASSSCPRSTARSSSPSKA